MQVKSKFDPVQAGELRLTMTGAPSVNDGFEPELTPRWPGMSTEVEVLMLLSATRMWKFGGGDRNRTDAARIQRP
jgi:hypothetical protein